MLGGVAGGLAEYFEQDPTVVRVLAVLLAVVTSGTAVVAYLVMWAIVPEAPVGEGASPGPSYLEQWTSEPSVAKVPSETPGRAHAGDLGSRSGRFWFGAILIAVGVFALVERFVPRVDLWSLWPIVVIAIGVSMLFGRRGD